MRYLVFSTAVLCALLLSILGLVEGAFAQTAIDNPAGTNVTLSPLNESRAIGLTGGQTYTYSNSNWPGCTTWGLPATGLNLINGNVSGSCSSYDNLTFVNGSGTDLANGLAAWTGTTTYYISDGATYHNTTVNTRLLITVTDNSNNPIELYYAGGYVSVAIPPGNFTFKVKVELQAMRPADRVYYGSSTTGTCNTGVGSYSPAIHLFNCLATNSSRIICTQYPSTPSSRVFYQGFTNSTTAPSVTSTSPSSINGGSTTSSSMTFNWSGSMGTHPASSYQYRINGGAWQYTVGTQASQSLSIGANTFCVRYYDGCNVANYPNNSGTCYTIYYTPNNVCSTIDHGGNNWTISSNTTVAGQHINVGTFQINSGRTATVSTGCEFHVEAQDVNIIGTIDASGRGNLGGGSGGGAGYCNNSCLGITGCDSKDNCRALITYGGSAGSVGTGPGRGRSGSTGGHGYGKKQVCYDWDDEGGRVGGAGGGGAGGGGSYGANGGAGGSGGSGGYAGACRESGCSYNYSVGSGGSGGGTDGSYGAASDYNIRMGSGGAAAAGGGRGKNGGSSGYGSGGAGGGEVKVVALNTMTITGTINANGNNGSGSGGNGGSAGETGECCNDWSGGCDERTRTGGGGGGGGTGGGSGGGILLRADGNMNISSATLQAQGGNGSGGGSGGSNFSSNAQAGSGGASGGGGSGGRIKVFYNPCASNSLNPNRSLGGGTGANSGGSGTYTENAYGIIPVGSTVPNGAYVWNGQTSIDWNTGSNWSRLNGTTWTTGTVPGTTADVIVPGPPCTPRNPTISTNAGTIKTLEIHALDGAEVTITSCPDCLDVTD